MSNISNSSVSSQSIPIQLGNSLQTYYVVPVKANLDVHRIQAILERHAAGEVMTVPSQNHPEFGNILFWRLKADEVGAREIELEMGDDVSI